MPSKPAVAVDIGRTAIRGIEFTPGAPAKLHRVGRIDLPTGAVSDGAVVEPELVTAALKGLWKGAGFKSRQVILPVAGASVDHKVLRLDYVPLKSFPKAVGYQISGSLNGLTPEETAWSFHVSKQSQIDDAGTTRDKLDGVLIAARSDYVETLCDTVEAAGLRPLGIHSASTALVHAALHSPALVPAGGGSGVDLAPEWRLIVDVGADTATMIVLTADGQMLYHRRVPHQGSATLTERLEKTYQWSFADAERTKVGLPLPSLNGHDPLLNPAQNDMSSWAGTLIGDIRATVNFVLTDSRSGARITEILLCGQGTAMGGLAERIYAEMQLPTAPVATLRGFTGSAVDNPSYAEFRLAGGLAHAWMVTA